jgi:hypothetical protein
MVTPDVATDATYYRRLCSKIMLATDHAHRVVNDSDALRGRFAEPIRVEATGFDRTARLSAFHAKELMRHPNIRLMSYSAACASA